MQNTIIIIPCYNEEKRLSSEQFIDFINNHKDVLLLFVNDGSNDNTCSVLKNIEKETESNCIILNNTENKGKAEAIRFAIDFAVKNHDFDYIGYLDADLATPLNEIYTISGIIQSQNYKLVMGTRIRRMGATIERKFKRYILGRIFATASSLLLKIPVYDTQCGAKVMSKDIALLVIQKPFISRWLFDVEIIARTVIHLGFKESLNKILEYPLNSWEDKGKSKIKIKDIILVPVDLFRIFLQYNKGLKKSLKH